MKISILTLFPEMFAGPFHHSILKHAQEKNLVTLNLVNIRGSGVGKHQLVDDTPYGGGRGMVMRVDVLYDAIAKAKDPTIHKKDERIILLDARGKTFHQTKAVELSTLKHLIVLCGHYEGVDERIRAFVDETISVGDFILTGGEIPAMLITDAVTRLIPGVLSAEATASESFSLMNDMTTGSHLEFPQYTKPRIFHKTPVPEVLLS